MKTPELGFGRSNSVYNLEKGPRVRVQPLGTRGPLRCTTPELLAAICHGRSSTQGSPRFQKLARDREEVSPHGHIPAVRGHCYLATRPALRCAGCQHGARRSCQGAAHRYTQSQRCVLRSPASS